MTFIIDMITGERIATDQPVHKRQAASAINGPAANEALLAPRLQPVCSQETTPSATPEMIPVDIADLIRKFEA